MAVERLYLGTQAGVLVLHLTEDGWDSGAMLWRDRPISAIAVDPAVPERIHVSVVEDGIYRSEDGGRTWERYLWAEVNALAVRPGHPELVYAGAEPAEVYRSIDSGSYWMTGHLVAPALAAAEPAAGPQRVRALAFDRQNEKVVYAGIEAGGIVATFDGGQEWSALPTRGLPADVQALVVRSHAPEKLIAGTSRGVYCSDDRGFHWSDAGAGMDWPNVLALLEHGEALLAAAHPRPLQGWWDTPPAQVFRLLPAAVRWWPVTEALDGAVHALAGGVDGGHVFLGTTGGSVWTSRDGGASWVRLARGLPPIRALAASGTTD
jgi:photosystem II stability/assembly factor-like uncharacterized protein